MADLKFSVEEDNLLIRLIGENKTLYDPESKSYKDVFVRDSIWSGIAKQLHKPEEECRKRWKHIRDSYNRFKRKKKCGIVSRTKNSKWDFYKRLGFLEKVPLEINTDIIVNDSSDTENVSSSWLNAISHSTAAAEQQTEDDDDPQTIEDSPFVLEDQFSSPVQEPHTGRRSKRKFDELLQHMKQREENRLKLIKELSQTKREDIDDDDYTFSNHVRTVLKKLSPRMKIQAKKEIFDALAKYEALDLDVKDEGAYFLK